jgi:hypothetical protein
VAFRRAGLLLVLLVAFIAPPAPAAASPVVYGGRITRTQILIRAMNWVRLGVAYSQDNSRAAWDVNRGRRYRTDCSGFVSMAWALDPLASGLGRAPVTWELPRYATPIRWARLASGDILLRLDPADRGSEHVELFERWAGSARRTMAVLESSSSYGRTRRRLVTVAALARAGYAPYRYRNVISG